MKCNNISTICWILAYLGGCIATSHGGHLSHLREHTGIKRSETTQATPNEIVNNEPRWHPTSVSGHPDGVRSKSWCSEWPGDDHNVTGGRYIRQFTTSECNVK